MATALEQAIDSFSDPQATLADALRRLLVVSRRIGAEDLTQWIRSELNGYANHAEAPEYRQAEGLSVTVRFDGPMNSFSHLDITARELPDELSSVLENVAFTAPVAELEALAFAEGDSDPRLSLPLAWVIRYRQCVEEGTVPYQSMMVANDAYIRMPRTHLRGVLDRLRTASLDLVLGLEAVSGNAGDPSGPTVETEPRLADAVSHYVHVVAGEGAIVNLGTQTNVASGPGSTAIQLNAGDIEALLDAASTMLEPNGVEALRNALDEDGGAPGTSTRSFLDRVRSGTFVLAGGITANAAYDSLVALLSQVFPSF